MLELLAILAWPLVALCALGAGVMAWLDYAYRRAAQLDATARLAAAYEMRVADHESHIKRLAERVGQLEMAQGVKRRG